jgi:hypothetical protein
MAHSGAGMGLENAMRKPEAFLAPNPMLSFSTPG